MEFGLFLLILSLGLSASYALENVALGQPATQSGTHLLQDSRWGADKAVDGDTNPDPVVGKSCAIPDTTETEGIDKDGPAWWRVDLGQEFDVYQLKIYNRITLKQLTNTLVLVSNQQRPSTTQENICNEIIDGNPAIINVTCNYKNQGFMRGRYVQLWRKSNANQPIYLSMCEVEVLSCPPGTWGMDLPDGSADCSRKCPGSCQNGGICRVSDGTCPSGCADGFWGRSCDKKCHCAGAVSCNVITGSCRVPGRESGDEENGTYVKEASKTSLTGLTTGLIAGLSALGVVAVLLLGVIISLLSKRNRNEKSSNEAYGVEMNTRSELPAVTPTAVNYLDLLDDSGEYETPINY